MATTETPQRRLRDLRERADADFLDPPAITQTGRHQIDLTEVGIRVAVTRARYPNRSAGADLYVVTVSRLGLNRQPDPGEVRWVLVELFGQRGADRAEERAGGPLIRMFRVPPAAADHPRSSPDPDVSG